MLFQQKKTVDLDMTNCIDVFINNFHFYNPISQDGVCLADTLHIGGPTIRDSMILRISWAQTPDGHRLCGFDKGQSLAIKQSVKSLTKPCVAKLNRKYWFELPTFHRNISVKQGPANFSHF